MNMVLYSSVKRRQQNSKHAFLANMLALLLLFSSISVYAEDSNTLSNYFTRYSTITTLTYNDNSVTVKGGGYSIAGASFNKTGSSITVAFDYVSNTTYRNNFLSFNSHYDVTITGDVVSTDSSTQYSNSANSGHVEFTMSAQDVQNSSYLVNPFRIGSTGSSNGGSGDSQCVYTFTSLTVDNLTIVNSIGEITNNGNAIIVVNPGNAAYIGYNSATFNFLVNLDKPIKKYYSNARYGFATELPEGTLTFTPSTGSPLPLSASVPDLLGRSATWIGHVNTDTIGYFVVYNPVYDQNGNTNKPIRVTVTLGYMNVTQFPLTATDIGGDIVSTGSSDVFYISDGMQGVTDLPEYIYSVTDNGQTTTSPALTVPVTPYNYTTNNAENAESGLQGFIQQVIDLLSAPIKYIQNLYNSALGFFNYLTSLWSWLPPEVSTIIGSALAVLVVIGVIKFLWK